MKPIPWSDKETELLTKVANARPNGGYIQAYLDAAERHGYLLRSRDSICTKLKRIRLDADTLNPVQKVKHRWDRIELDQLLNLHGSGPLALVVQEFNVWAASNGRPKRSAAAIQKKLNSMDASARPKGEYFTLEDVGRALDISSNNVREWIKRGYLKARSVPNPFTKNGTFSYRYIHLNELKRLAKTMPWLFAAVSKDDLFYLLEDEKLAATIAAEYPYRFGRPRPVRWIEGSKVYPSVRAAAKAHAVEPDRIKTSIQYTEPVRGKHFEYVDGSIKHRGTRPRQTNQARRA